MVQKKEEFTSKNILNKPKRIKGGIENSSFVISTSKLSDKEIVVQISTLKINKGSIGEAISQLEDEGLVLLNANSFETFEDRVFYTLHFQVLSHILQFMSVVVFALYLVILLSCFCFNLAFKTSLSS